MQAIFHRLRGNHLQYFHMCRTRVKLIAHRDLLMLIFIMLTKNQLIGDCNHQLPVATKPCNEFLFISPNVIYWIVTMFPYVNVRVYNA